MSLSHQVRNETVQRECDTVNVSVPRIGDQRDAVLQQRQLLVLAGDVEIGKGHRKQRKDLPKACSQSRRAVATLAGTFVHEYQYSSTSGLFPRRVILGG